MRLLATADWHIDDYEIGENRLEGFIYLAELVSSIAKKEGVDAVVIAGDLINKAVCRPRVLDVASEVLSCIIDSVDLLMIVDGNHEIDKSDFSLHSVLSPLIKAYGDKILYNKGREINGLWFELKPYTRECDVPQAPEDYVGRSVLIGHGTVMGSTNAGGYEFMSGYDPEEILKHHFFAIFGDIHNKQVIRDRILVPGCPIQNRYDDPLDTGVWIVDINGNNDVSYKYIPIEDERFPKFVIVSSPEEASSLPKNYIVRIKTGKSKKSEKKVSGIQLNLVEMVESLIAQSSNKIENYLYDKALTFARELVADVKTGAGVIVPRISIRSIEIENFKSIGNMNVTFPNKLLFLGHTGSGKSSIFEAITWTLYGKCPTQMYVDDIIGNNGNFVRCSMELELDDKIIEVRRERNKGGSKLYIDDKRCDNIEKVIGISYKDFLKYVYFYQGRVDFFTTASLDEQIKFFGFLVDLGFIDTISNKAKELLYEIRKKISELDSKIEAYEKAAGVIGDIDVDETQAYLTKIDEMLDELELSIRNLSSDEREVASRLSSYKVQKDNLVSVGDFDFIDYCQQCPLYRREFSLSAHDLDRAIEELSKAQSVLSEKISALQQKKAVLTEKRYKVSSDLTRAKLKESLKEVSDVESLKSRKQVLEDEYKVWKFLSTYVFEKGLKTLILLSQIKKLEEEVQNLISFSGVKVNFVASYTKDGRLKGRVEVVANFDGNPRFYRQLSGGQKLFVDIAISLAVHNILRQTGGFCDFIIFDEVAQYFDPTYSQYLSELISTSDSKIYFATHVEDFKYMFDDYLVLKMENGQTKVCENLK